jgi:hypothetical protein
VQTSKVLGAEKTAPEYSDYRAAPINEHTLPEIAIVLSTPQKPTIAKTLKQQVFVSTLALSDN